MMNSYQTASPLVETVIDETVQNFDSRPSRLSRRAQFETRLNRQWRQQRRTLAIVGGALAFVSGLLWPSNSPEIPSARLAANAPSHSVSR